MDPGKSITPEFWGLKWKTFFFHFCLFLHEFSILNCNFDLFCMIFEIGLAFLPFLLFLSFFAWILKSNMQKRYTETFEKVIKFVQSIVYQTALGSNENILVAAPTGAGKTNVAMLTVLQTIQRFWTKAAKFVSKSSKLSTSRQWKHSQLKLSQNFPKNWSHLELR